MGEWWVLEGFGGDVELGVVGVTVEVQVELTDDVTKGEDITDEEQGAKD